MYEQRTVKDDHLMYDRMYYKGLCIQLESFDGVTEIILSVIDNF